MILCMVPWNRGFVDSLLLYCDSGDCGEASSVEEVS